LKSKDQVKTQTTAIVRGTVSADRIRAPVRKKEQKKKRKIKKMEKTEEAVGKQLLLRKKLGAEQP